MVNWWQDLWGKAGEFFGKASDAVDDVQDDQEDRGLQDAQQAREQAAEASLKQVEARQKVEGKKKLAARRRRRRQTGRGIYPAENLRELAEPEEAEAQADRPPDFDEWREGAADQSLREVGRRQGQPQVGEPARQPDDRDRAAGGDRTNEEIKETLEAIQGILEESRDILIEIKEKEPSGATYGP